MAIGNISGFANLIDFIIGILGTKGRMEIEGGQGWFYEVIW